MAESGGLLNRCTGLNLYPGFESLPHRQLSEKRLYRSISGSIYRSLFEEAVEQPNRERAARLEADFGAVARGVVTYTTDLLFRDLWLRPALAPRDRSPVTVASLISSGLLAQVPDHLNCAVDNAPGVLRRLAERVFSVVGSEGRLRETPAMTCQRK